MKIENSCEDCVFCTSKSELIKYIHRDETVAAGIAEFPEHLPVMDVTFHCNKHDKETFTDFTCDDFISTKNGGIQ